MSIKICAHEARYSEAVEAFNNRMRSGGSKWGFYVNPEPLWLPYKEGVKTWREFYLVLENDEVVRGGYALKPQEWSINGNIVQVADWQGPFTEAEINPKYSLLMLRSARSAEKRYAHLFSLGHSDKEADMLKKLGWETTALPFCLHVTRPFRFLRLNRYLRTSTLKRLASDILAFTFIGPILVNLWNSVSRFSFDRNSDKPKAEQVEEFGCWADDLWQENKDAYNCCAVRDRNTMNVLSPSVGWPGGTKLKIVTREKQVIGWSIVLVKQMQHDGRFGNLKVGQIADCFAHPDNAPAVLRAAHDFLKAQGVDLICMNFGHPAWINGLKDLGYFVLEDRRIFAFSAALKKEMDPLKTTLAGTHLTNMDGHGPHGFTVDSA